MWGGQGPTKDCRATGKNKKVEVRSTTSLVLLTSSQQIFICSRWTSRLMRYANSKGSVSKIHVGVLEAQATSTALAFPVVAKTLFGLKTPSPSSWQSLPTFFLHSLPPSLSFTSLTKSCKNMLRHVTIRESLNEFSWNLILGIYCNICWHIPVWVRRWKQ
jgi:hypothetical protein